MKYHIFTRKCNCIINYQEARMKLTYSQLNKLKSAAKKDRNNIKIN